MPPLYLLSKHGEGAKAFNDNPCWPLLMHMAPTPPLTELSFFACCGVLATDLVFSGNSKLDQPQLHDDSVFLRSSVAAKSLPEEKNTYITTPLL
jgi:hypothetical protein